jgi:hypothetical protein
MSAPATARASPRRPKAESKAKFTVIQRHTPTPTPTHSTNTCTCNLQPASAPLLPQQPSPSPSPALPRLLTRPTPPVAQTHASSPLPYPYRIHAASVADAAASTRVRQTEHLRPTSPASQAIYLGCFACFACLLGWYDVRKSKAPWLAAVRVDRRLPLHAAEGSCFAAPEPEPCRAGGRVGVWPCETPSRGRALGR